MTTRFTIHARTALAATGLCALLSGCANVSFGIPLGPLPISIGVGASNAGLSFGLGTGIGPIGMSAPLGSVPWQAAPPPPTNTQFAPAPINGPAPVTANAPAAAPR